MEKMSWDSIRENYKGQWVELVAYEWDWNKAFPKWATVRNHSRDRFDLISKIENSEQAQGTVVLFVGAKDFSLHPAESVAVL